MKDEPSLFGPDDNSGPIKRLLRDEPTVWLIVSIVLLGIVVMFPVSCFRRDVPQSSTFYPEPETVGSAGLYEPHPLRAWLVLVNGCQYAVFRNSGNSADATPISAVHAGNCTNEIHKAKEVIQASEVVPFTTIVTNTLLIRGKEPIQPTP